MIKIASVDELAEAYDLVIVGAGPAGLGAAITAASLNKSVLVVDENPAAGGQIYRGVMRSPIRDRNILDEDYRKGADLIRDFEKSSAAYASGATIWSAGMVDTPVGEALEVGILVGDAARLIQARHLILATGALERPFAIPGWTIPGVITAGAAQIALKSSGLVPQGRVVLAGCGPLLHLLAAQLHAAGANIVAFVDTSPVSAWSAAARYAPSFLFSPYLAKGLKLLAHGWRNQRFVRGATGLRVEGRGKVERILVERKQSSVAIDCDMVLLHHGVIPNINTANAIGCAQKFDSDQHCWVPTVDDWFVSSLPFVSITGDGAGIGGADSAPLRGALASLEAGRRLGWIKAEERDTKGAPIRQKLAKTMRGRRFLDSLYRPSPNFLNPADSETIACRCEEVTVGQVRDTTRSLDVTGPNQLKTFLRCGMGPCQGRICGPIVTEIMADARRVSMEEIGYYRLRPPFKPVTVAAIAALPKTDASIKAVFR